MSRIGGMATGWCSLIRERLAKSKSKRLSPMQSTGGSEQSRVPLRAGRLHAHFSHSYLLEKSPPA